MDALKLALEAGKPRWVAPRTAAAIREAVNAHPILSKVIHFKHRGRTDRGWRSRAGALPDALIRYRSENASEL
jgi:hypothetical protein